MGKINHTISNSFIFIIRGYQYLISSLLGPCCRFHPTCSEYTIESFKSHGFFHGLYLAIHRISRCHPWTKGGVDPVPGKN